MEIYLFCAFIYFKNIKKGPGKSKIYLTILYLKKPLTIHHALTFKKDCKQKLM